MYLDHEAIGQRVRVLRNSRGLQPQSCQQGRMWYQMLFSRSSYLSFKVFRCQSGLSYFRRRGRKCEYEKMHANPAERNGRTGKQDLIVPK